GRSRFMQRLASASHDASLIPVLESYASAHLAASDRKPIEQAVDRIRSRSSQIPRIDSETAAWLAAPGGGAVAPQGAPSQTERG
ncbi:MAG TPA: hypothetical protein VH392_06920, partial [Sphingomicrobium sp.]